MDFLSQDLQQYVEQHSSPENDLLKRINRETHVKVMKPRMLSGHLQGRVLSMFSYMVKPDRILEIGTFTGYSAVCLSEGLRPEGKLITIDINEELEDQVRSYFSAAGISDKIDYRIGDATTIIPELTDVFDLVFLDGDKDNYSRYFDLVIEKVRPGGFILADNVLWNGKVVNDKPDKKTSVMLEFNAKVQQDCRVENVLLPLRDGIMIMRRLSL